MSPGFTPLLCAAMGFNRAGVVKVLITHGADGTKQATLTAIGIDAASTALDIVRLRWNDIVRGRRFDNARVGAGAYTRPYSGST